MGGGGRGGLSDNGRGGKNGGREQERSGAERGEDEGRRWDKECETAAEIVEMCRAESDQVEGLLKGEEGDEYEQNFNDN